MNDRAVKLLIRKRISLESEAMYAETEEMGMLMAQQKLNKTQVSNLHNVAFSSNKTVDIFDYIKTQTGKDNEGDNWAKNRLGEKLLKKLGSLKSKADKIAASFKDQKIEIDEFDQQRIFLELCREFIKHTVAQFLYGKELEG